MSYLVDDGTGELQAVGAATNERPGANENPGILDLGKSMLAGVISTVGADPAAAAARASASADAPNAFKVASGIAGLLNLAKQGITNSLSDAAKDANENPFSRPVAASLLALAGMAAPAAALVASTVAAGPVGAAAVGGTMQVAQDINAAFEKANSLPDDKLQQQSPLYKELRSTMDETAARMELTTRQQGLGQMAASAIIGGLQFNRLSQFVPGQAVNIGTGLGAIAKEVGVNAALGGAGAASTDLSAQLSDKVAGISPNINFVQLTDEILKGAAFGGLLGGVGGAVNVRAARRAERALGAPTEAPAQPATPVPATVETPPRATTVNPIVPVDVAAAIEGKPVAQATQPTPGATETATRAQVPEDVALAISEKTAPAAEATPRPVETGAEPVRSPEPVAQTIADPVVTPPRVTPEVTTPRVDDTAQNVPESRQTLKEQQAKLVAGEVPAQMFPIGTEPLPLPDGMKSVRTPRGIFHYNPETLTPAQIRSASKAGEENKILNLGPMSKPEVAARAAQGETPVAVVERTPDGTEVKATLATEPTVAAQSAPIVQNVTPGNTVTVEPLQKVVADRKPRILPDLTQQETIATERAAVEKRVDTGEARNNRDAVVEEQDMRDKAARQQFIRAAKDLVKEQGQNAPTWAREVAVMPPRGRGKKLLPKDLEKLQKAHRQQVEDNVRVAETSDKVDPDLRKKVEAEQKKLAKYDDPEEASGPKPAVALTEEERLAEVKRLADEQSRNAKGDKSGYDPNALGTGSKNGSEAITETRSADETEAAPAKGSSTKIDNSVESKGAANEGSVVPTQTVSDRLKAEYAAKLAEKHERDQRNELLNPTGKVTPKVTAAPKVEPKPEPKKAPETKSKELIDHAEEIRKKGFAADQQRAGVFKEAYNELSLKDASKKWGSEVEAQINAYISEPPPASVKPVLQAYFTNMTKLLGIKDAYLVSGDKLITEKNERKRVASEYGLPLDVVEQIAFNFLRNPTAKAMVFNGAQIGIPVKIIMLRDRAGAGPKAIETIAHELGHIIDRDYLRKAHPAIQSAVLQAFLDFKKSNGSLPIAEYVRVLRSRANAKGFEARSRQTGKDVKYEFMTLKDLSETDQKYWGGFDEWFADNVARWAVTDQRPLSVVDRFFSRIAAAYRSMILKLKPDYIMPAAAVREFMAAHLDNVRDGTHKEDMSGGKLLPFNKAYLLAYTDDVGGLVTPRVTSAARSVGDRVRGIKNKLSTLTMLAQRASQYFETDAPRRVALEVEAQRVAKGEILNRTGGGNEITRRGAGLERTYSKGEEWQRSVALAYDATTYNVNLGRDADNSHLGKDIADNWQAKAKLNELQERFNALPEDLQKYLLDASNWAKETHNKISLENIRATLDAAGVNEPGLAERIHKNGFTDADKAKYGGTLVSALNDIRGLKQIQGMYFQLRRRGDYVVNAEIPLDAGGGIKVAGGVRFVDIAGKNKAARANAQKYTETTGHVVQSVTKRWVDRNDPSRTLPKDAVDAIPAYDVAVQTQHTEFHETAEAARKAAEALTEQGYKTDGVQETYSKQNSLTSMSLQEVNRMISNLEKQENFKKQTPQQQEAIAQALREATIRNLAGNRIQSSMLPRRNVAGFSKELVRNIAQHADASAGYLARVLHRPKIEQALQDMADEAKARKGELDTQTIPRSEFLNEMTARAYATDDIPDTAGNAVVRRLLQVTQLDKLAGVSYHVINSIEPFTVATPIIGARHGMYTAASRLVKAYDLIGARGAVGKGLRDTVKAYNQDSGFTDFVSTFKQQIVKNLGATDEAKRLGEMLDNLHTNGLLDRDTGMETNFSAHPASNVVGRGLDRADLMARQVGHAIEAINRSTSAIAAYQLEYAKTKDHTRAMDYAYDVVHDAMGNYSSTNAAPIFNHPLGRLALQFKKYGQKTYYLLGKSFKGMIEGDAEARKQFIGLMATHAVVAGSLGLPLEPIKIALILTNALGLSGYTYGDFEQMVRRTSADLLGTTGGELASKGLVRAVGINIADRTSLSSLVIFGEPKSNKANDLAAFLFNTTFGAPGATLLQQVSGAQALMKGNYAEAAQKLVPLKAVRDVVMAGTGYAGGRQDRSGRETLEPYSPLEAAARAAGFQPSREAETIQQRTSYNDDMRQYREARQGLINKWITATPNERARLWGQVETWNRSLGPGSTDARLTRTALDSALQRRVTENNEGTMVNGMRINKRTEFIYNRNNIYNN